MSSKEMMVLHSKNTCKGKICLICMNCNPELMLKEHAPGVSMKLCSMNSSPSVWKRFVLYQSRPVGDFWQKYDKKLACLPFSLSLSSFSLPLSIPFSLSSTLRVHLLLILMLIMSKTPKNKNLSNSGILKKKKQLLIQKQTGMGSRVDQSQQHPHKKTFSKSAMPIIKLS